MQLDEKTTVSIFSDRPDLVQIVEEQVELSSRMNVPELRAQNLYGRAYLEETRRLLTRDSTWQKYIRDFDGLLNSSLRKGVALHPEALRVGSALLDLLDVVSPLEQSSVFAATGRQPQKPHSLEQSSVFAATGRQPQKPLSLEQSSVFYRGILGYGGMEDYQVGAYIKNEGFSSKSYDLQSTLKFTPWGTCCLLVLIYPPGSKQLVFLPDLVLDETARGYALDEAEVLGYPGEIFQIVGRGELEGDRAGAKFSRQVLFAVYTGNMYERGEKSISESVKEILARRVDYTLPQKEMKIMATINLNLFDKNLLVVSRGKPDSSLLMEAMTLPSEKALARFLLESDYQVEIRYLDTRETNLLKDLALRGSLQAFVLQGSGEVETREWTEILKSLLEGRVEELKNGNTTLRIPKPKILYRE